MRSKPSDQKARTKRRWSIWLFLILSIIPLNACQSQKKINSSNSDKSRVEIVKERGKLICGVNGQLPGFSFVNSKGEYSGMDVDLCRAVAAALFDNPNQVEFRNLSSSERFTALQTGEVDILNRNTTWTIGRDTSAGMEFAPTTFYDGQGVMVKTSEIAELKDLQNQTICVSAGTTSELNLSDLMRQLGMDYTPVTFDDEDALYNAYLQGRCEAATADRSQLVAHRAHFSNPDAHFILDTVLSKEPLGPVVASGDPGWFDAVKWIVFALFEAEEKGITSINLRNFHSSPDPAIRRFLGLEGSLGEDMGLSNDFAAKAILHVGNYGEIYARNIGEPFHLDRGLNQIWTQGGLLYSPAFR